MNGIDMGVSSVRVVTTSDGGHPPEFYAERIIERLIQVSETAPPEIKIQALAYRETMRQIVLTGISKAILSDHTTIIARLLKAGMDDAAALVHDLPRR